MGWLEMQDKSKGVLILGLGNPLLGDEGLGVRVIEKLKELDLPQGVTVMEGGTAGLGLIPLMEGFQRVIVVDAADMGHLPGYVARFSPADVRLHTADSLLSPHQVGLGEMLAVADALEVAPAELVILGVQPSRIEARMSLSPEIEAAVPDIIRAVLDELGLVELAQTLG